MEFVIKTIRTLFFSLDRVIYGLIDDVYGLMLQLARTSVFSQDTINTFSERIYTLVGVFMLFKISVSLINYVLNPDDFSDKERGFNQIIKRVILSLVMIVLMPYIFTESYELQAIILEENTIMNVIFGAPPAPSGTPISSQVYTETAGQKIQFTIMYAFAQPNYEDFTGDSDFDLIDCTQAYETDSKGNYRFRDLKSTDGVKDKSHSDFIYQLAESCWGIYNPEKDMYEQDDCQEPSHKGYTCGALVQLFGSRDLDKTVYQQYAQGVAQQNFDMFFNKEAILAREDVNKVKEDNRYFINYKMGVSTAVGVAVLYLFLIFCIDIAIRSIKLGFLQMIAPIPILSYCDPKSSKDGMFQRWVKMCTTTYLDLFFRLAALYFGIYVISLVGTFRDVTTGNVVSGWLVSVFMIVGILIFVKKLPDIIKDVFNIKGDGKFTLNPMKKLGDEALGGKAIAGVGKRAIGLGAGLGTAGLVGAAGLMTGQGLHKGALGKAIAGGWRGDKFGKNFASSYGAGHQRHLQFKEAKAQGLEKADVRAAEGREGRQISHATQALKGIQNQYKQFESTATKADVFAKEFAKQEAAAIQRGDTDRAKRFGDAKENRINQIYSGKGGVVTKIEPGEDNENQKRFNNMINEIDAGTSSFGANTIEKYKIDHTVTPNATLQTIGESIGNAVNDTNSRYETVVGYTTISTDKGIVQMNKDAGTSLNSIETDNASIIAAGQIQPGGKLGKK